MSKLCVLSFADSIDGYGAGPQRIKMALAQFRNVR